MSITLVGIATHAEKSGTIVVHDRATVGPKGLTGDKPRINPYSRRQVTILSLESWIDACRRIGRSDVPLPWTIRRANLLVTGVKFGSEHIGKHIRIGTVILEVTGETEPCKRMNEQVPGLKLTEALTPDWRGGVTCVVVATGEISLAMEVTIE